MTKPTETHQRDYIARVAQAIWESEGRPDGRDLDHWMRAKRLVEEDRAGTEFPELAAPDAPGDRAPRRVQPGFEDAAPGMVPDMKAEPQTDIRDDPGGRFAEQVAAAPERAGDARRRGTPGPRNPAPQPPTNDQGYVAIPSVEDAAARASSDDPRPPPAAGEAGSARRGRDRPNPAGI